MANTQSPRITSLRETDSIKECKYWDFAQDKLGVPEDLKTNFLLEWSLFSQTILNVINAKLETTKNTYEKLRDFFKPTFFGDLFKPTYVFGSEIDVLLVLNGIPLSQTKTKIDDKEVGRWKAGNTKITEPMLEDIFQKCESAMQNSKRSNWSLGNDVWNKERLAFALQHTLFKVNLFPVLKLEDGFGYLCKSQPHESYFLEVSPDMDFQLSATNNTFHGMFELIKFWKVLLWNWNTNNPGSFVPPAVIDAVVLAVTKSSNWSTSTFYGLFDTTLSDLQTCIQQRRLLGFGCNLLQTFPEDSVDKMVAWLQQIKAVPKIGEPPTLLTEVTSLWDNILKNSTLPLLGNAGARKIVSDNNNDQSKAVKQASPAPIVQSQRATETLPAASNANDAPQSDPQPKLNTDAALPEIRVTDLLETEDQWFKLTRILDANNWDKFASHALVNEDPLFIKKLKAMSNPDESPSRRIIEKWQYKTQATSTNLIAILKQIDCHDAVIYVIELIVLHQLAALLDVNNFWINFANHPKSGVSQNVLKYLKSKPFHPGKVILREWRRSVKPMEVSLLCSILAEIKCTEGLALIKKYYQ
mmetsp:Transcript_3596/g.4957  ORF Transcript_3596/g.4957 Transcript_3596/m.4957 type:complete len:583 (-) Transcript_3596:870-2618(-)